jgi:hypothetical protein
MGSYPNGQGMLKLSFAAIAAAAVLALPAAYGSGSSRASSASVASTLLREMNSTSAGRITRRVTCTPAGSRRASFDCDLESVISTHLTARVDRAGGGLVTTWHPLAG